MIRLNLRDFNPQARIGPEPGEPHVCLGQIERQLSVAMSDLSVLIYGVRHSTVTIPSDVLLHAGGSLFPAERMAVIAGRPTLGGMVLGASYDVTGVGPDTHRAHVRSDALKLQQAMMGFELAGVQLAAWMHSHPGSGVMATSPSSIDRAQYQDWTKDFGPALLALIFVEDGHVRLWGDAIESGLIHEEIVGDGVQTISGHRHVYRLAR